MSEYPKPPEDLAENVAAVLAMLVRVLGADLMEKLKRPSPFRDGLRNAGDPQRPAGCYEASFGWVHVKPGCTCPR